MNTKSLLMAFATIGAYAYNHYKTFNNDIGHMTEDVISALENNCIEEEIEDFAKILRDSYYLKYELNNND